MEGLERERSWLGRTVIDRKGKKVGVLDDIYVDDRTGELWAAISGTADGAALQLAPLRGASPRGAELRLDSSRQRILSAPGVQPGGQLDVAAERLLFEHYGRSYEGEGGTLSRAA